MHYCSICKKDFESETPSVLTMGRSMTPRYMCPECEGLMDTAIGATEPETIKEAMAKLGEILSEGDSDDAAVILEMSTLMDRAKTRLAQIEAETYDFSLDETEGEEFELTEDLLETEEDRELDRQEEVQEQRMNTFLNWAWLVIGIGVVAYIIFMIVRNFI